MAPPPLRPARSLNPFFAFYFGALFVGIGGVVLYKVCSEDYSNALARQTIMLVFAMLVIVRPLLAAPPAAPPAHHSPPRTCMH